MKVSELEFTFSNKDIYNNKSISLSQKIKELLGNEKSNQNLKNLFTENFNFENDGQTKMYSVLAMKIEKNDKQYLGVYIKDITKTANKISKNTAEIVYNRQICTISHELKTPINQSLGLLSNIKHLTNDEECKSKLRLLRSSLYKLNLKVDEFLEYGKKIEGKLKPEFYPNKISTIFKEIMITNFNTIILNKPTFEFAIDPAIEEEEFPLDTRKINIVIQQFIDQILDKGDSLKICISAFISDSDLVITIQSFFKFVKSFAGSSMQLNELNFNSLKVKLDKAESRVNLGNDLLPLICNITGIKVNESNSDNILNHEIRIKVFENPDLPLFSKNTFKRNLNQRMLINNEFGIMRPKRNIVRQTRKMKHSMNNSARQQISSRREAVNSKFENSKVLVVDDNQMNRFPLCEILKSLSIKYEEAENGKIAVEKFIEISKSGIAKFLILMDLDMPIMDGVTSCTKIREIEKNKELKPTPIIAVSAYDSEIEIKKALNSGMNAFYKKPLKKSQLMEILNQYL